MSTETRKRIINDLDVNKASYGEILASLIKKCDFAIDTVIAYINKSMASGIFPESPKCAIVSPIHKKTTLPASILPR